MDPVFLLVVYFRPSAAGSGMPELIGYLNGTLVRHIFNLRTLAVKFLSCAGAVGSGMPVGPEGPMIHMGALVGAGVSQFGSKTAGFRLSIFERFRNSQDKRDFISAGAAAGVASAFGAPVGGLLFAMEEVSSHWSLRLSWQVFFCCMVSTFTTDVLDSSFSGFRFEGSFGQFRTDRYILFNVAADKGIDMNVLALIPSAVVGVVGGIMGAAFVFCNLKVVRMRRAIIARLDRPLSKNLFRVLEPVLILAVVCQVAAVAPDLFPCTRFSCRAEGVDNATAHSDSQVVGNCSVALEGNVELYNCPYDRSVEGTTMRINGSYSQVATLWFGTGEDAIHHLFSRDTHLELDYGPLLLTLAFYAALACWAAGCNVSSGLVVPVMMVGGLYGRVAGKVMVDLFGVPSDPYWQWIDPGAMAMVGAVSFFGGVTRLTMSLAVIMVEMTNDIQFLLLIMTAVMCSKWAGDYLTHPLYHALLELKCIPFLEPEPVVMRDRRRRLNLDLCTAAQVMAAPAKTVRPVERASAVAKLLLDTNHGAFPVVSGDKGTLEGLIGRPELTLALMQIPPSGPGEEEEEEEEGRGRGRAEAEGPLKPKITFPQITEFVDSRRTKENSIEIRGLFTKLSDGEGSSSSVSLDLSDLVSRSVVAVDESHSLRRTYSMFRSLGLRHLVVTGSGSGSESAGREGGNTTVRGVITRKDLMGFAMEDSILAGTGMREMPTAVAQAEEAA